MGRSHDATGRSIPRHRDRLQKSRTGPPNEPWAFIAISLMESDAFRSLSINARRALDRLVIEHFSHGRRENGNLRVAARQFHKFGVTKDCLTPAIRELEEKGLLATERGEAKGVLMPPYVYRLTFYATPDELPTNEWRAWISNTAERVPPSRDIIDVPESRDAEQRHFEAKKRKKTRFSSRQLGTGTVVN
jgi:DNA-binding HxlR family transcriptional regulator